jgi:hypothetical protein
MSALEQIVRKIYGDVFAIDYDRAPAVVKRFVFRQVCDVSKSRMSGPYGWDDFTPEELLAAAERLRELHGKAVVS